jgi:hypothetical protein
MAILSEGIPQLVPELIITPQKTLSEIPMTASFPTIEMNPTEKEHVKYLKSLRRSEIPESGSPSWIELSGLETDRLMKLWSLLAYSKIYDVTENEIIRNYIIELMTDLKLQIEENDFNRLINEKEHEFLIQFISRNAVIYDFGLICIIDNLRFEEKKSVTAFFILLWFFRTFESDLIEKAEREVVQWLGNWANKYDEGIQKTEQETVGYYLTCPSLFKWAAKPLLMKMFNRIGDVETFYKKNPPHDAEDLAYERWGQNTVLQRTQGMGYNDVVYNIIAKNLMTSKQLNEIEETVNEGLLQSFLRPTTNVPASRQDIRAEIKQLTINSPPEEAVQSELEKDDPDKMSEAVSGGVIPLTEMMKIKNLLKETWKDIRPAIEYKPPSPKKRKTFEKVFPKTIGSDFAVEISEYHQKAARLQKAKIEMERELRELRTNWTNDSGRIKTREADLAKLQRDVQTLNSRLTVLQQKEKAATDANITLNSTITQLKSTITTLSSTNSQLQTTLAGYQAYERTGGVSGEVHAVVVARNTLLVERDKTNLEQLNKWSESVTNGTLVNKTEYEKRWNNSVERSLYDEQVTINQALYAQLEAIKAEVRAHYTLRTDVDKAVAKELNNGTVVTADVYNSLKTEYEQFWNQYQEYVGRYRNIVIAHSEGAVKTKDEWDKELAGKKERREIYDAAEVQSKISEYESKLLLNTGVIAAQAQTITELQNYWTVKETELKQSMIFRTEHASELIKKDEEYTTSINTLTKQKSEKETEIASLTARLTAAEAAITNWDKMSIEWQKDKEARWILRDVADQNLKIETTKLQTDLKLAREEAETWKKSSAKASEDLQTKIQELTNGFNDGTYSTREIVEAKIKDARSKEELTQKVTISNLQADLTEANAKIKNLEDLKKTNETELGKLETAKESLSSEIRQLRIRNSELELRQASFAAGAATFEKGRKEWEILQNQRIEKLNDRIKKGQKEKEDVEIRITTLGREKDELTVKISNQTQKITELTEKLRSANDMLQVYEFRIKNVADELLKSSEPIDIMAAKTTIQTLQEEIANKKDQLTRLESTMADNGEKLKAIDLLLNKILGEHHSKADFNSESYKMSVQIALDKIEKMMVDVIDKQSLTEKQSSEINSLKFQAVKSAQEQFEFYFKQLKTIAQEVNLDNVVLTTQNNEDFEKYVNLITKMIRSFKRTDKLREEAATAKAQKNQETQLMKSIQEKEKEITRITRLLDQCTSKCRSCEDELKLHGEKEIQKTQLTALQLERASLETQLKTLTIEKESLQKTLGDQTQVENILNCYRLALLKCKDMISQLKLEYIDTAQFKVEF